jgi:hypothetical protein
MHTKRSHEHTKGDPNACKGETQNPHRRNWKHIIETWICTKRSWENTKEDPNAPNIHVEGNKNPRGGGKEHTQGGTKHTQGGIESKYKE